MKKNLLILLPAILLLGSCSGAAEEVVTSSVDNGFYHQDESNINETPINQEVPTNVYYEDNVPHIQRDGSKHVTYLMITKYGSLNVAGSHVPGSVSDKFYENTIVWEAEPGTALPSSASEVVSSVAGVTFRGWAYYSEDSEEIYPEYYSKVPSQSGLALKAIFDGTSSSGGGGEPTPTPTPSGTGYGIYFAADNILPGNPKGYNMDGRDEFYCASVSFTSGTKFKIYDYAANVDFISDFSFNGWSFGSGGDGHLISQYLTTESGWWKALQNFTADVYIQLKYQDNAIYFELK